MSCEGALDRTHTDVVVDRPWSYRSTDQLLDRLEWAYGETGGFEPEAVWELARRVLRKPRTAPAMYLHSSAPQAIAFAATR